MRSKRIFYCLLAVMIAVIALTGTLQTAQSSGGPDSGGYIYTVSTEPGGPAYSWDDISATGTALSLANDAMSAAIPISFPFTFYGTAYTNVYVSSNGFLTFLPSQPNGKTPAGIPTAATPNAVVAGYWADLNPKSLLGGASIRYQVLGSAPDRRLVVAYINVPHSSDNFLSPTRSTFEIKLFEGSSNIEVHYNSMLSNDTRHVAGIENETGADGLPYYDGLDAIPNATAVRYSRFTGAALRPSYEIKYGTAGSTLVYQQKVANWTGAASTFELTYSGSTWPTRVLMGSKDFTTTPLANGEAAAFSVEVDIPADAVPADYSQLLISISGGGYQDNATLVSAVPRRGYVLGYYNVDSDDFYPAIMPVDTKFHNSLHEAVDVTAMGPFIYLGSAMRPDAPELWIVSSGETGQAGYVFPVDLNSLNTPSTGIAAGIEASDIAFTQDGKTAVVSAYGDGAVRFIDTATRSLTGPTITTGSHSEQLATGACFPGKAYVTNNGANTVSVINIQTMALIKNISGFNKPTGIVGSPRTNRVYVVNNGNSSIGVIDTKTNSLIATWTGMGSSLNAIDITSDGNRLYVTAGTDVKVVNADTGQITATIPTGVDNLFDVKVFPESLGHFAYVTTQNTNQEIFLVVDTDSNTVVKQVSDDWNAMGLAISPMPTMCSSGPSAPAASFNPSDVVIHLNEPVTWTNTTTPAATAYLWDFGDGSTSTDANPTHIYTAAGSYIVTLTASSDQGQSMAAGSVNFVPNAAFTPTSSTIRPGESITFTNQSTGTNTPAHPFQYAWDFGDGTTSTEASPTHTFSTGNDTTIRLTVSNGFGDPSTAEGTVKFRPRAQFSPTQLGVSANEPVTFTNQSTGSGTLTYQWDFGDGSTSTAQNPTHTYNTSGIYTVTLTVTNANGSDSTTGTVGFKPAAGFTPASTTIDLNGTIQFTNTTTGPGQITYVWDFGDGSPTSSQASPQHLYSTSGNFTVKLTATNEYGSAQATGAVQVRSTDTTPPTVTMDQAQGQADPTNTSPITFTAAFSEPVTGFEAADVTLGGTAGATTVTISGGPSTYNVAVSGMTLEGTVTASIPAGGVKDAAGNGNTASTSTDNTVTFTLPSDLTIAKSHTGSFTLRQTGAQYRIIVSNIGAGRTSGTVTVVDTLPTGLTATALSGDGWSCALNSLTCTRSDALTSGSQYPTITLTVSVASNAPASLTNRASVSGGGEQNTANNVSDDVTTIDPGAPGTAKTTPSGTTCSQFSAGTASDVTNLTYTVRTSRIRTITPSAFIYYSKITAPAASFTIRVMQSNTKGWAAFSTGSFGAQIYLYNASCTRQSVSVTSGSSPTIRVTRATAGAVYYIAVQYQTSGVVNQSVTTPYPTVPYTFITTLDSTPVNTSSVSVNLKPQ